MDRLVIKCHSDESFLKRKEWNVGKPRKRETQNMVGELLLGKWTDVEDDIVIDKCLPPSNRYRTWLIKNYYYF